MTTTLDVATIAIRLEPADTPCPIFAGRSRSREYASGVLRRSAGTPVDRSPRPLARLEGRPREREPGRAARLRSSAHRPGRIGRRPIRDPLVETVATGSADASSVSRARGVPPRCPLPLSTSRVHGSRRRLRSRPARRLLSDCSMRRGREVQHDPRTLGLPPRSRRLAPRSRGDRVASSARPAPVSRCTSLTIPDTADGLRYFKERFGFRPARVDWRFA